MSSGRRGRARVLSAFVGGVVLVQPLAGCGAAGASHGVSGQQQAEQPATATSAAAKTAPAACVSAAVSTLGGVAQRVYRDVSSGRVVSQEVTRVARSTALVEAVRRDDPAAARAALREVTQGQVTGIRVMRGSRTLAAVGSADGIAPARGTLRDAQGRTVGTFVLTLVGTNGYTGTVAGLTASQVVVRSGSRQLVGSPSLTPGPASIPDRGGVVYRGIAYQVWSFTGEAFPSGKVRISLLVPGSAALACGSTAAATAAATIGQVGVRIYRDELVSQRVRSVVRYVERSRVFGEAVRRGDAVATREAIIGFFRTHLHVVRVRVTRGGGVLIDEGGPHVLAPVAGVVRGAHGGVVGRFQLAVQDDLGYMLLARSFTGAQVLMRVGGRQVMGSLTPGPASVPDRGRVVYRGVAYQVSSFVGTAFPSGVLRISLLVAEG